MCANELQRQCRFRVCYFLGSAKWRDSGGIRDSKLRKPLVRFRLWGLLTLAQAEYRARGALPFVQCV